MKLLSRFSLLLYFVMCNTAFAEGIIPFDTDQANTTSDISKMKCSQFSAILQNAESQDEKSKIAISEIVVWTHGVISGMGGSAQPFSKDFATGSGIILATRCSKYPSMTLFDVIKNVVRQK